MPSWFRISLFATALINLFGAFIFYPPFRVGRQLLNLPTNTDPLYLSIISAFIAIFAFAYYYLALKRISNPLLIAVGLLGKLVFAFSLLYFGFFRANSVMPIITALPDIAFAIIFAIWLYKYTTYNS